FGAQRVRHRVGRHVRADDRRGEFLRLGLARRFGTLFALRRSGRGAEGGALLRRYGAEWLHRGFESLLLRSAQRPPRFSARPRGGGRAVECGGLENRYPSLGGSGVQISPPPLLLCAGQRPSISA